MNINKSSAGHIAAFITIFIWGTTFISTKILLNVFNPIEILFIRFVLGYIALWCVCPRSLRPADKKQELYFAGAGLCGITLYYLLENIALTYTMASNVGVIISIAPFFTAIFSCVFLHSERPNANFYAGLICALTGICIISFSGGAMLKLNPIGDILAIAASIIWALYATFTKKISGFGYNTVQTTRRTFFYGLIFMIPALFVMGFDTALWKLANPQVLFNLIFLGLGASALCFVSWGFAVKILGPVKTSVYIYIVPVVTVTASAAILHEKITPYAALGIALTLAGLFISERGSIRTQAQTDTNTQT